MRHAAIARATLRPGTCVTPEPQGPEALFVSHLGWIERVAAAVCRRHGSSREDTEDFSSWAKLKLIEDDYAVFRKFRGESSITTYLTVVIAMLFRDYRTQHWGRWRPSAAARRHGAVAVRLETLVYRDHLRLEQAAEVLRTAGQTDLPDRELARLLCELPARRPGRPVQVGSEPLADAPAADRADDLVTADETEAGRKLLDGVLRRLPPEDQVMLRMRFWEGMSVADIARGLGLPQKPLYRRMDRALASLRGYLEESGVSRDGARAALDEWAV
jgi:RNA polymerase sigma factor (sigma-70 family)